MTEDDLDRRIRLALAAQAETVREAPPAPAVRIRPRHRRWAAPLLAAAAVAAVALTSALVLPGHGPAAVPAHPSPVQPSPRPAPVHPAATGAPVGVSLVEPDGGTYGVGMPIIALFTAAPTEARAFDAATTVTVDGRPVTGNWYFEASTRTLAGGRAAALEAHWRPEHYWPAHSTVQLTVAAQGVTAGPGLVFADDLALTMHIGAATVSTVDAQTHRMTVTTDGSVVASYPVAIGADATPTMRGIKVVMAKGQQVAVSGPGYSEVVQDAQRLTASGEYVLGAPWNTGGIGATNNTNGGTDLRPADAAAFYARSLVGDVVSYPNATGPAVPAGDGLGDWNVPWPTWQAGGSVPSR